MTDVLQKIADEVKISRAQVEATVALLKDEATAPFIARYRKDRTGGLDEFRVRAVRDRWRQLNDIEQRRAAIVKAITDADKLTPELQAAIESAPTRAELEDIYMPFRSRRRIRSTAAKQKGLDGLADLIWRQLPPNSAAPVPAEPPAQPPAEPAAPPAAEAAPTPPAAEPTAVASAATPQPAEAKAETVAAEANTEAGKADETAKDAGAPATPPAVAEPVSAKTGELVQPFIKPEKGVKDIADALSGARDIIAERIAEDAGCRKTARDLFWKEGKFAIKPREGVDLKKGRYAAFTQAAEPLSRVPAHRYLTAVRGAAEKQLHVVLEAPREKILEALKARILTTPESLLRPELVLAIEESFDRLLGPALDNEWRQELKRRADQEVITACARHLRSLLMQPPYGRKPVLAVDPAPGTGLKIAVLDAAGKVTAHATLAPEKGENERKEAVETLTKHIKEQSIGAVAIASGPGSREADLFVRDVVKTQELGDVAVVLVHLHAAAHLGREEGDVDAAARGAAAVGRYFQDPLVELAKVDATHITVGQHQHDVDQGQLRHKLEEVFESCVGAVGAEINTAGATLLRFIPGLNPALAQALVETRGAKGPYKLREELRDLPGAARTTFENCAGFLRVPDGANPLDSTAIHPETYPVVDAMAASANVSVKELLGNNELVAKLDLAQFKTEQVGELTLRDILHHLRHPLRDPRGHFVRPEFNAEVRDIADLKEGMILNGVVTNLTTFGAFVDIGVHQDGLVHISAITHRFIRDASDALKVGQRVKVKVVGADVAKKRISLSMRELEPPPRPRRPAPRPAAAGEAARTGPAGARPPRGPRPPRTPRPQPAAAGAPAAEAGAAAPAGAPAGEATAGAAPQGAAAPRPFSPSPDRRGRGDRPGGPRREGPGREGREQRPAKPVAPGKPDYSKFFVKSKRKMDRDKKKGGPRDHDGASRDEVRTVMKQQESGGATLADLLRKAGVKDADQAQ
jgi:uncharacterized protein